MSLKLSIVIPIFNEYELIPELGKRLQNFVNLKVGFEDFEVIFVNDGSSDNSLDRLIELNNNNSKFKILNLSRNFGHQLAITAGLEHADGDYIVVMDGDLQDPPELIQEMIKQYNKGYDVVYACRKKRKGESILKKVTASIFYRMLKSLSGIDIPLDTGDFRLMSKRAVENLMRLKESHRFVRGLVCWIGFKQIAVEYERDKRFSGETKYPFSKMLSFAWDGITSFSATPLKFASWLGGICIILSLAYTFYIFICKVFFPQILVEGWSSIIIIVLLLGGTQLFILGLIGEYIGRISDEVKKRPLYIVDKFYE
jgi:polyisoprenyl-phosphate glycosyltransferase